LTEFQLDILAAKLAEQIFYQPRWLKLKSAAKYSSIGQKKLIQLAQLRKIDGFQDDSLKTKPWIFDKNSIDKYRSKQSEEFNNSENEKIALDIVGSLNI
jgi:hypothetical protein